MRSLVPVLNIGILTTTLRGEGYLLAIAIAIGHACLVAEQLRGQCQQSDSQRAHIKPIISGFLLKSPNSEERYWRVLTNIAWVLFLGVPGQFAGESNAGNLNTLHQLVSFTTEDELYKSS